MSNSFLVAGFTDRVLAATTRLKARIDDLEAKLQEGMPVADLTEIENAIALIQGAIAQLEGRTGALESPTQTLATEGSVKLPGGLILKWGSSYDGSGPGSHTFPSPFPTACYSVTICAIANLDVGRIAHIKSFSATGFSFWRGVAGGTASGVPVSYLAVGK